MLIPHRSSFIAWSPALVLMTLCVLASAHAGFRPVLQFDRAAIASGELWRLFSNHLVHADVQHLSLNMAGLVIAWSLVGDQWRPWTWLALLVAIAAGVGAGLWLSVPTLDEYLGASGLLHGLLAAGTVGLWRTWRTGAVAIAVILALKGVVELVHGPLMPAGAHLDTIVEAHLIGSVTGALLALPLLAPGLRV